MWIYEKKLEYPVKIKNPNPTYAKIIISQLGGADGETAAAMRYLNQRYTMPYGDLIGILTDVGTEARHIAIPIGLLSQKKAQTKSLRPIKRAIMIYWQFLSTRSIKNCCFSFSVKRS